MKDFLEASEGNILPVGICTLSFFGIPISDWVAIFTIIYLIAGIFLRVKKFIKE